MTITVVLALLDYKAQILWSSSRILRKLLKQEELEEHAGEKNEGRNATRERLYLNYIRLGKSAHTRLSRSYDFLLEGWVFIFSSLMALFEEVYPNLNAKLFTYDPLVVFRFKIHLGALTVLGAWPLRQRNHSNRHIIGSLLLILVFAVINSSIMVLVGTGSITVREEVRLVFVGLAIICSVLFVLSSLYNNRRGDSLAAVCAKLQQGNGALEEGSLQRRKYDMYRKLWNSDDHRWRPSRCIVLQALLVVSHYISSSISFGKWTRIQGAKVELECTKLATTIFLESLVSISRAQMRANHH